MDIEHLHQEKLLLFKSIVGSHAYGTAISTSDTDHRGVYILPKKKLYGLEYLPQISDAKNDNVYYEIGRFVELLLKNNPSMLELLVMPEDCIQYQHPLFSLFKIEDFLSKQSERSFAGFAISQIKRAKGLNKKIVNPVNEKRKSILDFCYILEGHGSVPLQAWLREKNIDQERCGLVNIAHFQDVYALFYDAEREHGFSGIQHKGNSNEVSLSSIPKGLDAVGYMTFNKDAYKTYCKRYREYWDWVKNRNEARYENTLEHGKNYDSKNMMHTMRLLDMAEEIAVTGSLKVRRPNRDFLLDIRAGKLDYDDLVKMADDKIDAIQELYRKSDLPETTDPSLGERLLVEVRERWYG